MKTFAEFPNLRVHDHPLIAHKLSLMRDQDTTTIMFRLLLKEIATLMGFEITRDLPLTTRAIETPVAPMQAPVIDERRPSIISILRAGLGMAEGLHSLIPEACEGHIGLYRDHETKRPVQYYCKLPDKAARPFILVDPMLATGHSAAAAVELVKRHGVGDVDIRLMVLVAAPEGVRVMLEQHPRVAIHAAALDSHLNENAYIVPGLGDAGDRLFGTK
ncbi:MAG: uracil phosphoribosyltransferase [Alphaproteobacteria bacterium]|nr:uracil phosphoribosyltransferase [Alphaproteobacteria bacterium]